MDESTDSLRERHDDQHTHYDATVFEELSPPYATIVADPPWSVLQPPNDFRTIRGHSPLPYTVMDLDQIHDLPVESLAADYAHLYLWTINKYVRDARMRGWHG